MKRTTIASMKDVRAYFGSHSYVREFVGDYLIAAFRDPNEESHSHHARALHAKAKALRDIAQAIHTVVDYADASPLIARADALSA